MHPAGIVVGAPAARERAAQPVARALLPQWLARLVGLAALGSVGALEWQRQIAGYGSARAADSAIPDPMNPAPTTPISRTSLIVPAAYSRSAGGGTTV